MINGISSKKEPKKIKRSSSKKTGREVKTKQESKTSDLATLKNSPLKATLRSGRTKGKNTDKKRATTRDSLRSSRFPKLDLGREAYGGPRKKKSLFAQETELGELASL
eukprot:CAMPEP_0170501028 /NCGR_PEP_ID=MMETSP0208-20121228/36928_1 /TAXON_ID=197538 /ORGANISM="Strombidium inclinatum, Strain S3" /LENGTH=107 /DNA_ID=CAMNT_0010779349 /DNA_START=237 /DNA_END=560 /DNA_ORIENTATION=-